MHQNLIGINEMAEKLNITVSCFIPEPLKTVGSFKIPIQC